MLHYLVEIHDKNSEEIGAIMEKDEFGDLMPKKYDSFSQANAQAALIKSQLPEGRYTKVVSIESAEDTNESLD